MVRSRTAAPAIHWWTNCRPALLFAVCFIGLGVIVAKAFFSPSLVPGQWENAREQGRFPLPGYRWRAARYLARTNGLAKMTEDEVIYLFGKPSDTNPSEVEEEYQEGTRFMRYRIGWDIHPLALDCEYLVLTLSSAGRVVDVRIERD